MKLFISGYDTDKCAGIYDTSTKSFTAKAGGFSNLSFCTPGSSGTVIGVVEKEPASKLLLLDKVSLEVLDSCCIEGGALCHVAYLPEKNLAVGSCYGDGKIFSIELKGRKFFGEPRYISQGGRAHGAFPIPDGASMFTANISEDCIYHYKPLSGGELELLERINLPKGCGPRHIWPLDSERFWVITEYSNQLLFLEHGVLKWALSTLPEGWQQESCGSSIVLWKGFLYGANRGANTVVCWNIKGKEPSLAGFFHCGGDFPRHMAMVGENILAVTNQKSNNLSFIALDPDSGLKKEELESVKFSSPSCIFEME